MKINYNADLYSACAYDGVEKIFKDYDLGEYKVRVKYKVKRTDDTHSWTEWSDKLDGDDTGLRKFCFYFPAKRLVGLCEGEEMHSFNGNWYQYYGFIKFYPVCKDIEEMEEQMVNREKLAYQFFDVPYESDPFFAEGARRGWRL